MNNRILLAISFTALYSLHSLSMAATNEEIANELVFCGVIAEGGMHAAKNQEGKKHWEEQRTLYLGSASYLTSIAHVKEQHSTALARRSNLFEENPSGEKLAEKMSETFKACKELLLENHSKIMEMAKARNPKKDTETSPDAGQNGAEPQFISGQTTSSEVVAALGKPSYEDQNPDGRFVYNYETKTGNDVYLFDKEKKLIRVRRYCDSLKGKCD